ncbi:hypothetical protein [Streptomyces sp. x-80]|uniref:hypothetical protein n=1 Tax=Streptomyces sp. x-80 TaxID=2789282 RepID=UPI00397EB663
MSARDWLYRNLVGALVDPERVSLELNAFRAEVLREAADAINALPQDYECDPGRGDAADLLRSMANEAGKDTRKDESTCAAIVAERDAQIIAWLLKKAREYRSTGSQQHQVQADAIERMASKIQRGAVRASAKGGECP